MEHYASAEPPSSQYLVHNTTCVPAISAVGTSRRKNRRKNATPKNIIQLQDEEINVENLTSKRNDCDGVSGGDFGDRGSTPSEQPFSEQRFNGEIEQTGHLAEYNANNPDVDFLALAKERHKQQRTPDLDDTDASGCAIDLSSKINNNDQPSEAQNYNNFQTDDCGALDLSMPTNNNKISAKEHLNVHSGIAIPTPAIVEQPNTSHSPTNPRFLRPDTEGHIKEFAETAVNELLNMYGLGEEGINKSLAREQLPKGGIIIPGINSEWSATWMETAGKSASPLLPPHRLGGMEALGADVGEESGLSLRFQPSPSDLSHQDFEHRDVSRGSDYSSHTGALLSPHQRDSTSGCPDYGKYRNFEHCGQTDCREAQLREHFHCRECPSRVFMKKDEMIRHFKWHRKRDESLQHGFLRYSPLDDCHKRFPGCTHKGRQTHYHCIQNGCNKVYISTSDVQMHANYHRKDSAIMQQGFQRYRATEDCGAKHCPFYGQRTTHFHCRRPQCNFTFKNKADIEKHKTYHLKDDMLAKDGFKKYMKCDNCNYAGCRFSNVANHIHCARPGCDHVLHSTSQLLSHKRKHERRDMEFAYRKMRDHGQSRAQSSPCPAILNPALLALSAGALNNKTHIAALPSPVASVQTSFSGTLGSAGVSHNSDTNLSDNLPRRDSISPLGEAQSQDTSSERGSVELGNVSEEGTMDGSSWAGWKEGKDEGEEREDETDSLCSPDPMSKTHPGLFGSAGHGLHNAKSLFGSVKLPPLPTPMRTPLGSESGESSEPRPHSPHTGHAPLEFVPKISPPVNEKRERDETWKKYLTRYTANDPCHSRCQFLYKDHYHCNSVVCGVLFRTKDGVRDHARQHESLERVAEISYMAYSSDSPCVESCPYYKCEKHYHCLWSGCNTVIPESGPVFQRLDHYNIHDLSRTVGRKPANVTYFRSDPHSLKRKRGRPPKYPKQGIPVVPKLELDEDAIRKQTAIYGLKTPIAHGYVVYTINEPCMDEKCVYLMKKHFHCVRKRCHHATDNQDVLSLHANDFHNYVAIQDGFEFFDRNINCRRPHCHNNKVNRHFHCVRPKCDYSFVRYSTMAQHNKKHVMSEMGLTVSPGIAVPNSAMSNMLPVSLAQALSTSMQLFQNSADDSKYFTNFLQPKLEDGAIGMLPGHYTHESQLKLPKQEVTSPDDKMSAINRQNSLSESLVTSGVTQPIVIEPIDELGERSTSSNPSADQSVSPSASNSSSLPLARLLQQRASTTQTLMTWTTMLLQMHHSSNANCGRPFCKLKKKEHYHCFDCNQAFCDPVRLKTHAMKHGLVLDKENNVTGRYMPRIPTPRAIPQPSTISSQASCAVTAGSDRAYTSDIESDMENDQASTSLNLIPAVFTNMVRDSHANSIDHERGGNKVNKTSKTRESIDGHYIPQCVRDAEDQVNNYGNNSDIYNDEEESNDKLHIDESSFESRHMKSSSEGYRNPRKRSIGAYAGAYAMPNENNEFSMRPEKGRRVSHVDLPDGFIKYTSNQDCCLERCTYRKTLTHYHCTRTQCTFGTADRNRLLQHSERHRKTDCILGDSFRQVRLSQNCQTDGCEFNGKGTHYHCLKCSFTCLELPKVQAHKKFHIKQDAISAQGFQKVMAVQTCEYLSQGCTLSGRVTHYHCVQDDGNCNFVAQGQQAITSHNKSVHNV